MQPNLVGVRCCGPQGNDHCNKAQIAAIDSLDSMADDGNEYLDIEHGAAPESAEEADADAVQILIPHNHTGENRHSPISDVSGEENPHHGVVTEIGATRRGSFKNLDDHAGPVDPLSDCGEHGESARTADQTKIGTIRGGEDFLFNLLLVA